MCDDWPERRAMTTVRRPRVQWANTSRRTSKSTPHIFHLFALPRIPAKSSITPNRLRPPARHSRDGGTSCLPTPRFAIVRYPPLYFLAHRVMFPKAEKCNTFRPRPNAPKRRRRDARAEPLTTRRLGPKTAELKHSNNPHHCSNVTWLGVARRCNPKSFAGRLNWFGLSTADRLPSALACPW